MTVTFTSTPIEQPAGPDVGLTLWPQLKSTSHSSSSVDSVLLRCLVRGLSNGLPAPVIRRWLLANAEPALRAAVATVPRWHRLLSSARRHLVVAGSAAGVAAARLEIARRWVARVTTPLPAGQLTWAKEVNARAAISVIAQQQIALGWEKVIVTAPWLGSRLGWTRAHAHGVLKTLEQDLGWISRAGKRSGAIRWKLTRLGGDQGEELRDRAWLHAGAVDALGAQTPAEDKLATVLASVAAPAWHFSEDGVAGKKVLGAKAWIALVHAHAGLPKDEGLGLVPRTLSKMKRELERELPGALAGTVDLEDALSFLAEVTGATKRRAQREVQAAAEARANRERVERFRLDKAAKYEAAKGARAAFREVHHVDGTLGLPPADGAEFQAWVSRSAQFWNSQGVALIAPAGLWAARELLARAIADAGHDAAMVEKATVFVFREPVAAAA